MRKRIITPSSEPASTPEDDWLDLEQVATVEITSEDPAHPVESALRPGPGSGWRAAGPGAQTIRILFDAPRQLRRIRLHFVEPSAERTQELVLRWSAEDGEPPREIVRQQWTFSPGGATSELEDYRVELSGVRVLELTVVPDVSGGDARASLAEWRLA
ncbi:MAG TPA: hypothetical protein VGR37_23150 [Longimicrobiaceae bacterium]|nr:hypothetical protein [Longimicrobiaceae bacterium]